MHGHQLESHPISSQRAFGSDELKIHWYSKLFIDEYSVQYLNHKKDSMYIGVHYCDKDLQYQITESKKKCKIEYDQECINHTL